MDDDLTRRSEGGAAFGGGAGEEGDPILQRDEAVIGARCDAFGKDDERPLGGAKDFDSQFKGFAVHAFAIDGEGAEARQHESRKPAFAKDMSAGHDVDRLAEGLHEDPQRRRVAQSAMVGGQQDAMTGGQGGAQVIQSVEIKAGQAPRFFQVGA